MAYATTINPTPTASSQSKLVPTLYYKRFDEARVTKDCTWPISLDNQQQGEMDHGRKEKKEFSQAVKFSLILMIVWKLKLI